jgi:CBS domain containing-hemolysin-like protein
VSLRSTAAEPRRPSIDTVAGLVACVLLISANAVFVAAEFGLVAVDRVRIERDHAEGSAPAGRVLGLLRNLSSTLAAAQLGITLASLVLGFVAEPTVRRVLDPVLGEGSGWSVPIALVLATVFQTVFGELIPKSIAVTFAPATTRRLAVPIRLWLAFARPITSVLHGLSNRIVRIVGVEPRAELAATTSREELELLIRTSGEHGALEADEVNLLTRSIRFTEKTAADVLVPRVAMEAIHRDATVADLVARAVEHQYSRLPVFGADLDDIVGVVHVKSVFAVPPERRAATTVATIAEEVLAVPEGRELVELFGDFRTRHAYLAVVVDEHGGTAGIVTLEDLLEELVGEIGDEYDEDDDAVLTTTRDEAGARILPGSLHPDEVFEACGFRLPEGEYETLAGFVLSGLGHVPEPGERVAVDGWDFEVVAMDRLRVASVRVQPPAGWRAAAAPVERGGT